MVPPGSERFAAKGGGGVLLGPRMDSSAVTISCDRGSNSARRWQHRLPFVAGDLSNHAGFTGRGTCDAQASQLPQFGVPKDVGDTVRQRIPVKGHIRWQL